MDPLLMDDEAQTSQNQHRWGNITRMHRRGWFWRGGKLGRPTWILQASWTCLLLLSGAFIYGLLSTYLRWMAMDPFDVTFASISRSKDTKMPDDHRLYSASYFQNVLPVPCHSHNDYWRTTPLYAALGSGCVSVEADVWLRNGELYVGHSAFELTEGKTLSNTYLNPLHSILETTNGAGKPATSGPHRRGVFYMSPSQTLTLLIDLKTSGDKTLAAINTQLQPLRDGGWLTYWNGSARIERPVTVVASGNAPFDTLIANTAYRDVFYDAPLAALSDPASDSPTAFVAVDGTPLTKYNPSNSHLASAKLSDAVGPLRHARLSAWQLHALQGQILAAKRRGLMPRYWGTPRWPRGLRDEIWEILVREEVGLLSVDDLRAARKGLWGLWPQDNGGGGRG